MQPFVGQENKQSRFMDSDSFFESKNIIVVKDLKDLQVKKSGFDFSKSA